jgi:hypothetical protein
MCNSEWIEQNLIKSNCLALRNPIDISDGEESTNSEFGASANLRLSERYGRMGAFFSRHSSDTTYSHTSQLVMRRLAPKSSVLVEVMGGRWRRHTSYITRRNPYLVRVLLLMLPRAGKLKPCLPHRRRTMLAAPASILKDHVSKASLWWMLIMGWSGDHLPLWHR